MEKFGGQPGGDIEGEKINWEKLTNALKDLGEGFEMALYIKNHDGMRIYVENNGTYSYGIFDYKTDK